MVIREAKIFERNHYLLFLSLIPLFLTIISFLFLSSTVVSADDTVVDDISINVPVSCTLSGTGMNTHTATILNGNYASDIGTTNLKAVCNDSEGFSIYAIGYTDNIDGKTVMTSSALNDPTTDIVTGTATTGNTSNWAMKLETNPNATYPITIQNNFNNYHVVPEDYTMVAKRTAGTDVGSSATGSVLTSTYQVYVSPLQFAGTYIGKVKYVMVHPNYVDADALSDAITVVFDGNGLTFPGGATTNTVKYANVCTPGETAYVGNTYQEVMTSNISTGGVQSGGYTDNEYILRNITLPNADKVKVVVEYGITGNTMGVEIVEGSWDGDWDNLPDNYYEIYDYEGNNMSGTQTFIIDGGTVTIFASSWDTPESGYNKGFYAKIYPIYNTEQPNTTQEELPSDDCSLFVISGSYETLGSSWYGTISGAKQTFVDESEIADFLFQHFFSLSGSTITLYKSMTWNEAYANANKTQSGGYYVIQDADSNICENVGVGQTTSVIDNRDNNVYMIGKLKDGNCWLLDNLRLDPTDSTTATNMSSSNTNASSTAITNYLNGGNINNVNGWTDTAVSNVTSGFLSYTAPRINNASKNTLVTSFGPAATNNQAKTGIFYNYCSATAGTYCYPARSGYGIDASYDICPANWRLPTADRWGEYYELYSKYNTTSDATDSLSLQYNLSTPLSGSFRDDSTSDDNYQGIFWSSTQGCDVDISGLAICNLSVRTDYVDSEGYNYFSHRNEGYSIRCILSTSD